MFDLAGRVAIVTGASRGIGRAIALRLASAGVRVVAGARADHAQAVVDEIAGAGGTALAVQLDVTEPGSVAGIAHGPRWITSTASTCW